MRTEGYQALRCPTCGEGIFVLPRSPLPEPPTPATTPRPRLAPVVEAFPEDDPLPLTDPSPMTTRAGGVAEEGEPEVEIDWVDAGPAASEDGPEVPATAAEAAPGAPRAPRNRPKPKAVPADPAPTRAGPASPGPTVLVAERPSVAEWAWRHRNRLLVAAVALVVVGAVAFSYHRKRLEDLPRIAEIGRTEGLRKLDAGEFHAAKKLLADASSAVDGLGGRYEGAESIRQGAREAAIFTDLVPESLDRLVEEAATYSDANAWSSHFAGMYRGRSVLLEAPISAVPDPDRPGSTYRIEAPIYYGRGARPDGKARIDLAGFRLFELSQPKVGEQQLFGARLASLELDTVANEWVLTFEPDSGVYITHPRALEAIGWPSFEGAEEPRP